MDNSHINIKVDPDIKIEAAGILKAMGLDLDTAINMFMRQIITSRAFPFKPSIENYSPSVAAFINEVDEGNIEFYPAKSIEDILNED